VISVISAVGAQRLIEIVRLKGLGKAEKDGRAGSNATGAEGRLSNGKNVPVMTTTLEKDGEKR